MKSEQSVFESIFVVLTGEV